MNWINKRNQKGLTRYLACKSLTAKHHWGELPKLWLSLKSGLARAKLFATAFRQAYAEPPKAKDGKHSPRWQPILRRKIAVLFRRYRKKKQSSTSCAEGMKDTAPGHPRDIRSSAANIASTPSPHLRACDPISHRKQTRQAGKRDLVYCHVQQHLATHLFIEGSERTTACAKRICAGCRSLQLLLVRQRCCRLHSRTGLLWEGKY